MRPKLLWPSLTVIFACWLAVTSVRAQTPEPTPTLTPSPAPSPTPTPEPTISPEQEAVAEAEKRLLEIRSEQEKVRKILDEIQGRRASLNTEIEHQDLLIQDKGLEIQKTLQKIELLKKQIAELEVKISRLEEIEEKLMAVTKERITATYKSTVGGAHPLFLIFGVEGVGDFVNRYKYFRLLQLHDKKLLTQVSLNRNNYAAQQELHQQVKAEAEEQEAILEEQKNLLNHQKQEKEHLLEVTKSDEKLFQEKLEALLADEKAIEEAIKDMLSKILEGLVSGQAVSRGQVIGRQGNTGNVFPRPSDSCSDCGSHLHFMILTCGSWECAVNPESYLGQGEYARPLDTWEVTQGFGPATCTYCGYAFHNGIDLVYDGEGYGASGHGAPIKAMADGEMFYGTDSAGGKYAIIKHKDDLYSAYWHLQ